MAGTVAEFLATYAAGRLAFSHGTAEQYRIAVRSLESHAGRPVLLAELSSALVTGWLRALLERGRSPSTANSRRGAVLTLWRAAAEVGLSPPVGRVPKAREPERLPVVWTIDEVERIWASVAALPGQWAGVPVWLAWRIGLSILWDTGCRLAELLQARLADVWMDRGVLFVPAKNRKGRRRDRLYRLHAETIAMVAASLPSEREKLFPFPFQRRQIWGHYRRILAAAGLPSDRWHMLHCIRRTVESYAAAARGIQWAADAVGHTVDVARRHYVSPLLAPPPALIDAVPRPHAGPRLRVV
jgi:integrase